MKILMVSMKSMHFERWTAQLKDAGHEVYWFDIRDQGRALKLPWVHQITGWKKRFFTFGRTFLKRNLPKVHDAITGITDNKLENAFEKTLEEIKPDVVHSFVLYISCTPILQTMKDHPTIKWVYSSWGSDLYYFKELPEYRKDIEAVLPRVDHMFADCHRDLGLATDMGFAGKALGVFPGGGGYDFSVFDAHILPLEDRKTILVKGYQGRSGRAIPVIKALKNCSEELKGHKVVVFGAHDEVVTFVQEEQLSRSLNIELFPLTTFLPHERILKLMGEALLYIGNSNSDGMPNTLLEAVCMGAFPIQSNPGNASAEVIQHKKNGLLISDCENVEEITSLVQLALSEKERLHEAMKFNLAQIKPNYEYGRVREGVLAAYKSIADEL